MKQFIMTILSIICITCFAGESVDKTVAASTNGRVALEVVRGKVSFHAWDKKAVKVKGTLDEKTEKFIFKSSSDEVVIKVKLPNNLNDWGSSVDQTDIAVYVPISSSVDFNGVSTDFTIKGIKGGVDGNTVSGEIEAKSLVGDLDLNSISGDIAIKESKGKLRLNAVSGNLSVKKVAGIGKYNTVSGEIDISSQQSSISANSVSGDIELRLSKVDNLEASTVSGEQNVALSLKSKANLELSSVSGEVDLSLDGKINARFNLESSAGGDISNGITKDEAVKEKYGPASSLSFSVGDGSGNVEINTTSGDISVSH